MIDKDRGLRITRRMEALNVTREQLAELCDVTVQAVDKWRAGSNLPAFRVIQLSVHLSCTTDYLLLGVEGKQENELISFIAQLNREHQEALLSYLQTVYNKK